MEAYVPKVHQKDQDIVAALQQKLTESFMFRALEPSDLKIVIDAMQEVQFKSGDMVINQGDDGDVLYFVF
jgi:cAMP-dependent protein kinase regulator